MMVGRRPKPGAVAAAFVLGAILIMASVVTFDGPSFLWQSDGDGDDDGAHRTSPRRRHLRSRGSDIHMHPWARTDLLPPTSRPGPGKKETVLFWHIPKSGGSTAKSIYRCVGMGESTRVASTPHQIRQLQEWGLLEPGAVDVVFTSSPGFAAEHILDSTRKGRAVALFRHPVERLVSKFYYLQVATWEPGYNPAWKDLSLLDWARDVNRDNDHMVKRLAGKKGRGVATEADLQMAAKTVRRRFVVGLTDEMEESVRRFNAVMGVDEGDEWVRRVMATFFGGERSKRINSNPHPEVESGSPAWDLLAEQNALDIRLYECILEIFREQKAIVDSYKTSSAAAPVKN